MAWRLARSLRTYIDQINELAPGRGRASDGTIGDAAHAAGTSDHNPRVIAGLGSTPVVTAADITHDPARGCDFGRLAERLRVSRDGRIKYVIFNRRMFSWYASGGYPAWTWRPYSGSNPHVHHGHLSVVADTRADLTRPWAIQEADMALSAQDLDAIANRILSDQRFGNVSGWTLDHIGEERAQEKQVDQALARIEQFGTALKEIDAQTDDAEKLAEDHRAELAGLRQLVLDRPPAIITQEMVNQAFRTVLRELVGQAAAAGPDDGSAGA